MTHRGSAFNTLLLSQLRYKEHSVALGLRSYLSCDVPSRITGSEMRYIFWALEWGITFFWGTLHPPAPPQYSVAQERKFSSFSVSNRNQGPTETRPSCSNVKSLRTYEIVYHMQTLRDEHVYVKRWLVRGLTEACHGVGPALPLSVKPRYILNGDAECCGR